MSDIPHITLHIRASKLDADGRYQQVTVANIEDTTGTQLGLQYSKYMQDIVAHALSFSGSKTIEENNKFTYTFPFALG